MLHFTHILYFTFDDAFLDWDFEISETNKHGKGKKSLVHNIS